MEVEVDIDFRFETVSSGDSLRSCESNANVCNVSQGIWWQNIPEPFKQRTNKQPTLNPRHFIKSLSLLIPHINTPTDLLSDSRKTRRTVENFPANGNLCRFASACLERGPFFISTTATQRRHEGGDQATNKI